MDPISALSVAAAALQFVDFSGQIVCKSRELYRSGTGTLRENREAETATMRLKELAECLRQPAAAIGSSSSRLQGICQECVDTSDELIRRLHTLKVPQHHNGKGWKSFRQALKSVWAKHEINATAAKLLSLRAELDTEILMLLRQKLAAMSMETKTHVDSLDAKAKETIVELLSARDSRTEFRQRFDELDGLHRSNFERLGLISLQQDKQFQRLDAHSKSIIEILLRDRVNNQAQVDESHRLLKEAREAATELIERDNRELSRRMQRVELSILESLRFADMTHRPESISTPHTATFEWIFQDLDMKGRRWDSFVHWVSHGSGIYWIQGKPASGKSTLMRFVCQHQMLKKLLSQWAGSSELLFGTFYFWNSGSEQQRSHSGLLRTLLYETISQRRDLILQIFPEEWARKRDLALSHLDVKCEEWSLGRLQEAFKSVIKLASSSLRICLFIDGLDEYDGEPGDIADYIHELADEAPLVKICVSGRPLSSLQAVFGRVPGLKLQDLTQSDISRYVADKIGKHEHMMRLARKDMSSVRWLIAEIVKRAQGVFLWVILVVKSLIQGLRSGDNMVHLQQRLEKLPVDLENLFLHILNHIEPDHKQDSSMIFQIFRASGHSLDLVTLHRSMAQPSCATAIEMPIIETNESRPESGENNEEEAFAIGQMKLWLSSRCRGLLEVIEVEAGRPVRPDDSQYQDLPPPEAEQDMMPGREILPLAITSGDRLPPDAFQSLWTTESAECEAFVKGLFAAKLFVRYGSRDLENVVQINSIRAAASYFPENPALLEDAICFTAMWLSQKHGGTVFAWIQLILTERQRASGLPSMGLKYEWQVLKSQQSSATPAGAPTSSSSRQISPQAQASPFQKFRKQLGVKIDVAQLSQTPAEAAARTLAGELVTVPAEPLKETTVEHLSQERPAHPITYLHRTARDYLEAPRNWNIITRPTSSTEFDPHDALLMALLIEAKTVLPHDIYQAGTDMMQQVNARLAVREPSKNGMLVIDELERSLTARTKGKGLIGARGHWSQMGPKSKWGSGFDIIAVELGMTSLIRSRHELTSAVYAAQKADLPLPFVEVVPRFGVPLLAISVRFGNWATERDLDPKVKVVEDLLQHGSDPNEVFEAHTVWEYMIHWVHVLHAAEWLEVNFEIWLRVFMAMLTHGADPYACCMENPEEFRSSIGVGEGRLSHTLQSHGNQRCAVDYPVFRGRDDGAWNNEDTYPYFHSVESVVRDVFVQRRVPGTSDLLRLLSTKKRARTRPTRSISQAKPRGDWGDGPRWIS